MQVATTVAAVGAVYMRLFLPDSVIKDGALDRAISEKNPCVIHLDGESAQESLVFRSIPSLDDMLSLLRTRSVINRKVIHLLSFVFLVSSVTHCGNPIPSRSSTFTKAAIVAFFSNLGDVGLHTSLMVFIVSPCLVPEKLNYHRSFIVVTLHIFAECCSTT